MTFTQDFFRFERLGFQCNPFRALTTEEWQAIAVLSPALIAHLQTDAHLQIMGEMGRGKTTTLMGILDYFIAQGADVHYEYIAEGHHRFKTKPLPAIFLLDEAQRLWWWEKRRLLGWAKGSGGGSVRLIFTTHADLSSWFQRAYLPLTTLSVETMPPRQLAELLTRRLDYFRLEPSALAFTPDGVAFLAATFGDNRRSMERFLYEVFQSLPEPIPLDQNWLGKIYAQVTRA